MKISQIINSQEALNNLITLKLPVKVSYKISKLINRMNPDLQIFEEERNKLIKKLGVGTNNPDNPNEFKVKPENMPEFQEDLAKLLDIDVNISFGDGKEFEKIKIDDFGDVSLTANELSLLDWLIE